MITFNCVPSELHWFWVIQITILNDFKDTVRYFNRLCCCFKLVLKSKDLQWKVLLMNSLVNRAFFFVRNLWRNFSWALPDSPRGDIFMNLTYLTLSERFLFMSWSRITLIVQNFYKWQRVSLDNLYSRNLWDARLKVTFLVFNMITLIVSCTTWAGTL